MPADLTIDRRTTRSLTAVCRAAVRQNPEPTCALRLLDGSTHGFRITEVLDDALLGARIDAPAKACLVHLSAIAMIEFG